MPTFSLEELFDGCGDAEQEAGSTSLQFRGQARKSHKTFKVFTTLDDLKAIRLGEIIKGVSVKKRPKG